jgi:ABC-type transporter Mla maintaining outer membrane lipid asymmetry ATPase subunit MlaF
MTLPAASMETPPCVLEMKDVTVSRLHDPSAVALKQVNWSVGTGDYWLVAGRHLSGKTDLMMTAAGLIPPQTGTCRILGHEFGSGEALALARHGLGVVFDGGQLLNRLTVAENIALPICYHRNCAPEEAVPDVSTLLELAGLVPLAKQAPSAIGRNWRQRAGLARALALKPRALLLDSPLSGLDPVDTNWWLNLLDELSSGHEWLSGQTITVVVTGDDLRPWVKRARQFALIRDRHLIVSANQAGEELQSDPMWVEFTGARHPQA